MHDSAMPSTSRRTNHDHVLSRPSSLQAQINRRTDKNGHYYLFFEVVTNT